MTGRVLGVLGGTGRLTLLASAKRDQDHISAIL
jgi:hypothetical protein